MRGILEGHFGAYLGEAMVGAGKRRRNMDEHTTGQRDERDWADRHHVGLIRQSIRNDILEVAGGERRGGDARAAAGCRWATAADGDGDGIVFEMGRGISSTGNEGV